MTTQRGYIYWIAHGRQWRTARPVGDLAKILRGYGYSIGTLGDERHLEHKPPEDHTPYSATGWPIAAAYGAVWALDIMPPAPSLRLPTLAELGAQIFADRMAGVPGIAWLKYMNWTADQCVHDSWEPDHRRTSSSDTGHNHLSCRSDCDRAFPAYDPVARFRAKTAPHPQPSNPPPGYGWRQVRAGDSLASIARAASITVDTLRRYNTPAALNRLTVGEWIRVRYAAGTKPTSR